MSRPKVKQCLLLIALLVGGRAVAQNLPEKPVANVRNVSLKEELAHLGTPDQTRLWNTRSPLPDAPSMSAGGTSREEVPPSPPVEGRMGSADRTFWVANSLLMGSTIANVEMISRCRPASCQSVPDALRSRSALYGIGIPATVGVTYISRKLKRGGSKWWIVPVAVLTVGNVVYAAHAAQWSK